MNGPKLDNTDMEIEKSEYIFKWVKITPLKSGYLVKCSLTARNASIFNELYEPIEQHAFETYEDVVNFLKARMR